METHSSTATITVQAIGVVRAATKESNGAFLRAAIGPGRPPSNGDRNGLIDDADYQIRKSNFGRTRPAAALAVAVPEPPFAVVAVPNLIRALWRPRQR